MHILWVIIFGTWNGAPNIDIKCLGNDANKALRKLLEKNLLGIQVKDLKHPCDCGKEYAEGFCSLCYETICSHCGIRQIKHHNCEISCMNCKCGHSSGIL